MAVDREKILQTAQKLVDKKKYDKAIGQYRKLVQEDPGDVRTLLKIGDLHLRLEEHEQAIATYEQVGEFYYREGFSVKAIAVYKQIRGIIKRHAPHLEGRYGHIVPRLAEIYTQLGLTSDALAAYDEVATRLRAEGRERDALDIFRKVVELDPQNPIAHLRVADSRARLGDMDKAVERFGEAANIMVKLGRIDDALKVLERLLEYRQDAKWAQMAGALYIERGEANDGMAALTKLQIAFKANPKDLETLGMLASAFDAIDQPKKAVEVLKESARIAKDTGDDAAFNQLLDVLMQRAPDDTLVGKLDAFRRQAQYDDVSVEILEEAEIELGEESVELDEVLELDDEDLLDGQSAGEKAAQSSMFAADTGEDSAVRRLIGEAERQRASGHVQHAIQLLRDGLRNLGGSTSQGRHPLRQKLSDLLLEAGDQAGSITEKLILAQEYANEGQVEPALEMLDEVLLLSPSQPDALQMRANLGFPAQTRGEPAVDDLQLNQPLQSYDVESGGVEEALHRSRHHSASQIPSMQLDDPFLSSSPPQSSREPLPSSHPIGGPPRSRAALNEDALDQAESLADQQRFDEARAILHGQLQLLPNHPLILERLADIDAMAAQAQRTSQSGPYPIQQRPSSVQQGPPSQPIPLSQQEPHYDPYAGPASQQQYDQGYRESYVPHSSQHPPQSFQEQPYQEQSYQDQAHQEQAHQEQAHQEQAYQEQPYQDQAYQESHQDQSYQDQAYQDQPQQGGYYDQQYGQQQQQQGAPQSGQQWASEVDSLLDQVREGVRNQVAESDAATHYDLGVAYHEMGLHTDAISELTLAARDLTRECVCLSMIGNIQLQQGDYDAALDAFHRALNAQYKTVEQEAALGYEIANTYELQQLNEQALHYWDWLHSIAPAYNDMRGSVVDRIHRLRNESGAVPRPNAPQVEGEGMAEAFDDMFEEGS